MNSRSICIGFGVILLMVVMYFTGQWVGRQANEDFETEMALNAQGLSMLTKNEFLEVSKILNDPRTTNYPLPANYNQDDQKFQQGIQSVITEKTPFMAPPITQRDTNTLNEETYIQEDYIKPTLKTKDIFMSNWVRDLSSSNICQSNQKHEPLLLSVVISAPSHFKERAGIREGWGKTAAQGTLTTREIRYLALVNKFKRFVVINRVSSDTIFLIFRKTYGHHLPGWCT